MSCLLHCLMTLSDVVVIKLVCLCWYRIGTHTALIPRYSLTSTCTSSAYRRWLLVDEGPALSASELGVAPDVDDIINVDVECVDDGGVDSLCSDGSSCINADLGVFCQCYVRRSDGEEVGSGGEAEPFLVF